MGPLTAARRVARIGYYGAVRAYQLVFERSADAVGVTAPPPAPLPPELSPERTP